MISALRSKRTAGTSIAAVGAAFLAVLIGGVTDPGSARAETFRVGSCTLESQTLLTELEHPWSMAFLPGVPQLLVSERPGRLLHADFVARTVTPVSGTPQVEAIGQGGLLDIALDPNFVANRMIYLSFSEPRVEGAATAVGRGRLDNASTPPRLLDFEVIFRMNKASSGGRHFGSRLAFAPDGTLFITIGDRGQRDRAQDPSDHAGSIVRINPDGSIPGDNPFVGREGANEIWSIGHRNPQGSAIEPATGAFWTVSHGARGGDEINRPEAGKNYGWPVISYGRHYSGATIGEGPKAPGMEQPIWYWDPSIAPSGMTFVTGPMFPSWEGDILVGALKDQLVSRLMVENGTITGEERMFTDAFGRVRDVRMGQDGDLWVLTDSPDGELIRIVPVEKPC
jgi:glucose/arabinose dehydrogenase